jgi:hypothetical protein
VSDTAQLEPIREAIDDYEEEEYSGQAPFEDFEEGVYDSHEDARCGEQEDVSTSSSEEEDAQLDTE